MNGKGSKEARFAQVYEEFFPVVMRVVWRVTANQEVAEELCQDAFIKLYERLDAFPDNDQVKYWMIRVCKNHALNWVKRKQRERKAYEKVLALPERKSETAETRTLDAESSEEVRSALLRLPEKMREILVMKEYADLNYRDIAKALGISEANVKVRVFRARQKLAQILGEEGFHAS